MFQTLALHFILNIQKKFQWHDDTLIESIHYALNVMIFGWLYNNIYVEWEDNH